MRRISPWAVALLAAAAVLAGTPVATADPQPAQRPQPVTLELPVRTVETPGRNGHNGTIRMRVGGSAPLRVIVDTGFSGLLIFPGAWDRTPAGVTVGTEKAFVRAPNGQRIRGLRGSASMSFAGVTTTEAIPFVYSDQPNRYLQRWTDLGVYGLLGVGTKGGASMVNPFTALPGILGRQWSIHFSRAKAPGGMVTLGAPLPPDALMTFPLPYVGTNAVGAPLWDDQAAPGCWTLADDSKACLPTWFDAAFTLMRVKGAGFADLPVDRQGYLRTGTPVTLAAPGAAFTGHTFTAGQRASRNLVTVIPRGDPLVNTGNSFYFDYTLGYDLITGRIALSDSTITGARS